MRYNCVFPTSNILGENLILYMFDGEETKKSMREKL